MRACGLLQLQPGKGDVQGGQLVHLHDEPHAALLVDAVETAQVAALAQATVG